MWTNHKTIYFFHAYPQQNKGFIKGYYEVFNSFPQLWKTANCGLLIHCGKLLKSMYLWTRNHLLLKGFINICLKMFGYMVFPQ